VYGSRHGDRMKLAADKYAQPWSRYRVAHRWNANPMWTSRVFRKRIKYISGLRARVKLLRNILRKLLYIRDNASHARYKTVYLKCIKR